MSESYSDPGWYDDADDFEEEETETEPVNRAAVGARRDAEMRSWLDSPDEELAKTRAERERRWREAQADAPTDPHELNRRLINEQGPALSVGWTRGEPPAAPTERGFDWESGDEPPPFADWADYAGIDPQSPVIEYIERARDDFDSSRSTPYLFTDQDGNQEWRKIAGTEQHIIEALSTDRSLGDWKIALRRGRPSAEAAAVRKELATRVAHLVDAQGAQAKAVAQVLDCGRDAVHALLREGRAKSDT